MAYISDNTINRSSGGTTVTGTLPSGYAANDLLIFFVSKDTTTGGSWTTPSGYTKILENAYSGTSHCAFYKIAGASETAPTSGTTDVDEYSARMVLVKDVNTSNPINVSNNSTDFTNQQTSSAVTTTVNDCLILYLYSGDISRKPTVAPGPIALGFDEDTVDSGIAWSFQKTSGAASTITINKETADDSQIITLGIESSGTPVVPPIGDPSNVPATIVTYSDNTTGGPFGGGTADPSVDLGSGIGGLTYSYDALTLGEGAKPFYFYDGVRCDHSNTGISGGIWTFNAVNLSGKRVVYHINSSTRQVFPRLATVGDVAVVIGLRSGGNDYKFWHVAAKNSVPSPVNQIAVVLDVDDADYDFDEVGTFDSTNVDGVFIGINNPSGLNQRIDGSTLAQLDTATAILGSSSLPVKIETLRDITSSAGLLTFQNQNDQSGKQWFVVQDFQIGNGSDPVYFEDSGVVIEGPKKRTESEKRLAYNVDADVLEWTFYGVSGDTIKLTDSTVTSETSLKFTIHASSTSAATWDFSGTVFSGLNVTWQDIFSTGASNITYRDCTFVGNGANFSGGCLFDNTQITLNGATEASLQALLDDYANCDLINGSTAIRIEYTGTGDISLDFDAITWTNNTTDIHYNSTNASALTAVMENGANASTTAISGSATGVTISSPTLTLTVNSNVAGSDLKIFTTNTQTIEASATGTTVNTTNTGTYDITVQKAGYLPQRQTGVALGSSSVTVNITLIEDPIYNSSHGLTFTTDYSYNASTRVMTIVANQEGRDLYSALIDDFISETSLRNCPFPLVAIGPDRIDFKAVGYYNTATTVGATIDAGDIQFWKGAGMEWEHDTTGNPTKKFYSIKTASTLQAGSVVGYTQVNNGTPVESTLVSNQVNEVIQYFEDTDGNGTADYDYTGHLLFKAFKDGYYQARWDVINDSGVSSLESYEYTINLAQEAIAGTTGNQSITITTLTDHTLSPLVVGGKNFDYELVDPGANTAENLLAQYNYDVYNAVNTSISGTLYTSYQAFDLPDLVVEAGSNYETERGHFEGDGTVTDLSGVYLSRSSSDHPDIARFQSNDGTYYTPAVTANISISNLPDDVGGDTRLQIYNVTTATEYYSGDPAGTSYSDSYTDGVGITAGDSIRIRFAHVNGGTSFELGQTFTTAATSGFTLDGSNFISADNVYALNGVDGSGVTKFTADFTNDEIDLSANADFTSSEAYAFYCYQLTTSQGIEEFWGGIAAADQANYKIVTATLSLYFDNTTTASKKQTDNARIYRDDDSYPVKEPTTSGFGIDINWKNPVYVQNVGGSALTAAESAKLTSIDSATSGLTYSKANELDVNIKSVTDVTINGSGTAVDPWGP